VLRLRDLMSEEAYQAIRYNHVRLHRQYVMPNGKRHDYDFYMICFGPMPLAQRGALAEAALAAFGADGAYARKQKSEIRSQKSGESHRNDAPHPSDA